MGRGSGREALRRARRVRGVTRAAFGRRGQTRLRAPELPHHAARRAAPLARARRARRRRRVAVAAAVVDLVVSLELRAHGVFEVRSPIGGTRDARRATRRRRTPRDARRPRGRRRRGRARVSARGETAETRDRAWRGRGRKKKCMFIYLITSHTYSSVWVLSYTQVRLRYKRTDPPVPRYLLEMYFTGACHLQTAPAVCVQASISSMRDSMSSVSWPGPAARRGSSNEEAGGSVGGCGAAASGAGANEKPA